MRQPLRLPWQQAPHPTKQWRGLCSLHAGAVTLAASSCCWRLELTPTLGWCKARGTDDPSTWPRSWAAQHVWVCC